jgi:predicted transcriptional regulator
MSILHAQVKGGHILVDEPTDLAVEDEMTVAEQADLEAAMDRGGAEIAAGKGVSSEELLARVRAL